MAREVEHLIEQKLIKGKLVVTSTDCSRPIFRPQWHENKLMAQWVCEHYKYRAEAKKIQESERRKRLLSLFE